LTERERAILTYVEKLTVRPATIWEGDVEALRAVGLDDTGILQVNLIASWFNYINRVADGLGVGKPGVGEPPADVGVGAQKHNP
jgi:alkylhydroperoxidase family enzyme